MALMLWVKQAVKLLLLPPTGPLLLSLIGFAIARRRRRTGWTLALVGVAALTLLSIPAVGALLVRCLDRSPPLHLEDASGAQAIVIFGGGTRRSAPEYGGVTLATITLDRVRYGARIARATGLPILVSGGALRGAPPEAILMRQVLTSEFGLAVRWAETRSRNTHENAVESAKILDQAGVHRVVLVGHSFDFPRSRNELEAAGIEVIPAPIGIPPALPGDLRDLLPSARGLELSYYATYEILANVLFAFTPHPRLRPMNAG